MNGTLKPYTLTLHPPPAAPGARSQVERMDALDAVREFRTRVVVATDLIARGVDLGAPRTGLGDCCVSLVNDSAGALLRWYNVTVVLER